MPYDTNRSTVPVHRKPNTTRTFQVDPGTMAQSPIGVSDGSLALGEILTADSEITTTDWQSSGTTQIVLPVAELRVPRLRRVGLVQWAITGDYSNSPASNTAIEAQLMVDTSTGAPSPVATGAAFQWTQNSEVTATGVFIFTAELHVIGNLTSPRHVITAKLLILNSSGTAVIGGAASNTELSQIYSLDSLVDQTLGFQIRRSTAGANSALSLRSVGCRQPIYTSGV